MRTVEKVAIGATAALATLWIGWAGYVDRRTDRVPYDTVDRFDGTELRRYPETVLVETAARDQGTAFNRLFRYLTGANEAREDVPMTVPVATRGERIEMATTARTRPGRGGQSETVAMTSPVRTDRDGEGVTMAFYLPAEYTPETAPRPTDQAVRLVVEPARTVAVRRFSWFATGRRVDRQRRRLLDSLTERDIPIDAEPVLLRYDAPWTPPFMRTNEVAVDVTDDVAVDVKDDVAVDVSGSVDDPTDPHRSAEGPPNPSGY